MRNRTPDGKPMHDRAAGLIKPNDRPSFLERMQRLNCHYRTRILDRFDGDYRGLRVVLGAANFITLTTTYLARYPSDAHALRNLGDRLERLLREELRCTTPRERVALDMVRFESAQVCALEAPAKPIITPDAILDSPVSKLRLGLQPYLSLLRLDYAVDDFLIRLKKREAAARRGDTSNGIDPMPRAGGANTRILMAKRQEVFVAVYRDHMMPCYKRLDRKEFLILSALALGETVESACHQVVEASHRRHVDWPTQIKEWLRRWSALGWFCRPSQFSGQLLF